MDFLITHLKCLRIWRPWVPRRFRMKVKGLKTKGLIKRLCEMKLNPPTHTAGWNHFLWTLQYIVMF